MNEPKQWLRDALKNKVWLPKFLLSWIFSVKLIDIVSLIRVIMHKWIIKWPISWHLTFQETTKPLQNCISFNEGYNTKIELTEVEGNIVRCCKLFINRISTLALMNPTPLPSNILRDPFHLNTKYWTTKIFWTYLLSKNPSLSLP